MDGRTPTPQGVLSYYLVKFSSQLHENDGNWTERERRSSKNHLCRSATAMTIKHPVMKFVIYDEKTLGSVRYYIICLKLYEKKEYLINPPLACYNYKTSRSVILITIRKHSVLHITLR